MRLKPGEKESSKKSFTDKSKRMINRMRYARRFKDSLVPDLINSQKQTIIIYFWMLIVFSLLSLIYMLVFRLPDYYVSMAEKQYQSRLSLKEHLDAINTMRTSMLGLISGLAVFGGAYLTLRNVAASERNVSLSREGQITDRFIKGVEKLGSDKLEMRLGGIYALERIARDSERDHWPIMEILTAFVREHATVIAEPIGPELKGGARLRADIEAIITVLRRRNWQCEQGHMKLDLRHSDLRGADLTETCLVGALFSGAILDHGNFDGSDLEGADFSKCNLRHVRFNSTFLQDATFNEASLTEVSMDNAHLNNAWFINAKLTNTSVINAMAREATFMRAELTHCDFGRGDYQFANFNEATIVDVSFHRSHMEWAKLIGATVKNTNLDKAFTEGMEIDADEVPSVRKDQPTEEVQLQMLSKK